MEELQTGVFSYLGTTVCDLISQHIGDHLETYCGQCNCTAVYMLLLSKETLHDTGSLFCNLYEI